MANKCDKCGHENAAGIEVCSQCAAPLRRTCHHCNFENPPNFKFCGNCGSSLSTPLPPATPEPRQHQSSPIPSALAEKMRQVGKEIEGQRRNITVLFADISGFTGISEKLDPEQVYNLVDSTLRAFTEEIYRHEGTLDRFMGDGVMAIFGAPVAHEDDPARAIRAALGMQQAIDRVNQDLGKELGIELQVRMGLNSGIVVVGSIGSDLRLEYTALGDAVNVAARLEAATQPGTILVSRPVYEQTRPLFEFRELGPVTVRGRVEPVETFQVLGHLKQTGRIRGIPGLTAPMVGREAEFARLRQITDELVDQGKGRIVLLTGEAGIGKTRLTSELKGYLTSRHATVLEGACLSYGQGAYGAFLSLFKAYFRIADDDPEHTVRSKIEQGVRRVLRDRPATDVLPYLETLLSVRVVEKDLAERVRHLEPAQLQQQTFLAIRDLLIAEAQSKPLVIIFEDIHWIDKLSLDLLTFLLGSVETFPLLIFSNSRPQDGPAAQHVRQVGSELHSTHFVDLSLRPLSHADSVALVDLLLTIAELPDNLKQMIPQRAEGNPFYLEEIIRMLIDRGIVSRQGERWQVAAGASLSELEVPRTLQGLITARADHLSEGARQALQYASVVGRDFSYRLLNTIIDSGAHLAVDVQELEERELIHRVPSAPEQEYRFHHILIQETVYNGLLIRRREQMHHRIAEGIEALYKGRIEDYTEQLAFHYAESKDAACALPYLIRAGQRAAERFANDQALHYFRLAAEFLGKTSPTLDQRIEVFRGLGQVQTFVGDYAGSVNSYLTALELTRTGAGAAACRASAEILRRIGRVYERRGEYVEALRWLENALAELARDPDSERAVERARIYNDIGWVHYRRGQLEEAYQWRMRSLQIVEGSDHYNEAASAYNGLVGLFTRRGDWARAIAYAEKGLRLREMIGDSYGVSSSHNNLGSIAFEQCDLDKALYHFEQALAIKSKIGDVEGISRSSSNLGQVCRDKGDYGRAVELSQRALAIAENIKNGNALTLALNNLAQVKILQEHFDAALLDLTRSLAIATQMGHKERLAEVNSLFAQYYLGTHRLGEAEDSAKLAAKLSSDIGRQLIEGEALRTLARIARARSDWSAAEEYLQQSLAIFGNLKNPLELARSQFELALVQRDRGSPSQARATCEAACTTFARLGAQAERQRALFELERLSSPPPAAAN